MGFKKDKIWLERHWEKHIPAIRRKDGKTYPPTGLKCRGGEGFQYTGPYREHVDTFCSLYNGWNPTLTVSGVYGLKASCLMKLLIKPSVNPKGKGSVPTPGTTNAVQTIVHKGCISLITSLFEG